jgi:hypothetical protein
VVSHKKCSRGRKHAEAQIRAGGRTRLDDSLNRRAQVLWYGVANQCAYQIVYSTAEQSPSCLAQEMRTDVGRSSEQGQHRVAKCLGSLGSVQSHVRRFEYREDPG